jgi:hypothetical protein
MKPVINHDDTILNAAVLRADDVAGKHVLCPACGLKVLKKWPGGWDGHAATCEGLTATSHDTRKIEYRSVLNHLFRRPT